MAGMEVPLIEDATLSSEWDCSRKRVVQHRPPPSEEVGRDATGAFLVRKRQGDFTLLNPTQLMHGEHSQR